MAAGVHQDRGLSSPMQNMEGLTDAEMAKVDPGQTVFIDSSVAAEDGPLKATAVFRSVTAGADTPGAQELERESTGVLSAPTTAKANCGDGAGEAANHQLSE